MTATGAPPPRLGRWLFDTNIVLHLLRNREFAARVEKTIDVHAEPNLTSRVVIGECRSFVLHRNWGEKQCRRLYEMLSRFVIVDIHRDVVLDAYARLDVASLRRGRPMGKNDLWIAACAVAADASVVTCDGDFDHLADAGEIRLVKIPTKGAADA